MFDINLWVIRSFHDHLQTLACRVTIRYTTTTKNARSPKNRLPTRGRKILRARCQKRVWRHSIAESPPLPLTGAPKRYRGLWGKYLMTVRVEFACYINIWQKRSKRCVDITSLLFDCQELFLIFSNCFLELQSDSLDCSWFTAVNTATGSVQHITPRTCSSIVKAFPSLLKVTPSLEFPHCFQPRSVGQAR